MRGAAFSLPEPPVMEVFAQATITRINWFIRRGLISSFDALSSLKFWWCTIVKPRFISGCILY
jgi:hypothetical protein